MQNYRQGDKICLFGKWSFSGVASSLSSYRTHHTSGFSRGAYTARALAGFLFKVRRWNRDVEVEVENGVQIGLLPRDNEEQIPFAYRLYKRTDTLGCQLAAGYKQTFCTPVVIDFVGVW